MDGKWKVELYKNERGERPVEKFIETLEPKARLKVFHAIELLQEFGLEGGHPHIKKLAGSDLWEYRILGSDNIRLFYIAITGKAFLLLHGFKKKKQKTPTKEIRIAEERLREYRIQKSQK